MLFSHNVLSMQQRASRCDVQGETVPYIICIDRSGGGEGGEGAASGKGLAQRAYHIDEVRAPGAQLEVDAAYYLSQQVRMLFPSASCAFLLMYWVLTSP